MHAAAARSAPDTIAYIMIGANGIVRGKKVTSLARWPPNPSRCWALTWRTIGPMEDYWARSGGLLAEWPLSTSGGVFPLTRLTTDALAHPYYAPENGNYAIPLCSWERAIRCDTVGTN